MKHEIHFTLRAIKLLNTKSETLKKHVTPDIQLRLNSHNIVSFP